MPGFLVGAVKAAGAGFEGWASTSQLDRQGDIVLPEAFASSIEAFRANGPIFWGHAEIHNPLAKPIGRATDAVIRDGGLHIKARWAQTAEAQEVRGLVTDGIVSTLSVGFNPKMAETRGGVNYITDLELLEVSVVAIPANIGAAITRPTPALPESATDFAFLRPTTRLLKSNPFLEKPREVRHAHRRDHREGRAGRRGCRPDRREDGD